MPHDKVFEQRLQRRLADLRLHGLERTLRPPAGVDLSSNDYLNLSTHPHVARRLLEGVARDGCGSTGSRLLRGERDCFGSVERRFAAFKGTERALFFGSGYLANLAVLGALAEQGDIVFSDERNHASLIDGMRLSRASRVVFPHNDVEALATAVRKARDRDGREPGVRFVVVESLFSMDGDVAPLPEYAALCRAEGAVLVVDEAHAVGVYGARGGGLLEELGVDDAVISINTAGKALGVAGAFVAGPARVVEYLVQRARPFVFSTAPPPALAHAVEGSLDVIEAEPRRRLMLRERAAFLRSRLADCGITTGNSSSHIIPIVVGDSGKAVELAGALQAEGFDVRAIRPPSVAPGTARLRVSVNAALEEPTLFRFVQALAAALEKAGLCSTACS
jgi:8-amino-7-oxononanoate synthase